MASNGKKGSGNTAPTQNEQKKQTAEKKNDAVQHETEQQPVPNISVRIDKLFDDDTKKLKAFASANVGPFAVHGIRVFENEKGMFVSMPSVSYKDGQGNTQYDEVFHPVSTIRFERIYVPRNFPILPFAIRFHVGSHRPTRGEPRNNFNSCLVPHQRTDSRIHFHACGRCCECSHSARRDRIQWRWIRRC